MFSQSAADELLGLPASTMRDYARRVGVKPDRESGTPVYSIGDLVLIKMALELVKRGYTPRLATGLVFKVKDEFHRLVVEEGRGARAWLIWRPDPEEPGDVIVDICREDIEALFLVTEHDNASILPVHDLLRVAMIAVIEEARNA